MVESIDRYPLAVLLELRERELEEARGTLSAAQKRVVELETAHNETAARADKAERALSAFQIEVDDRLDAAFTAAERQWLADEEQAFINKEETANAAFRDAVRALKGARQGVEDAQKLCAERARMLKAARRHRELWIARRRAAIEDAEDMDMEARALSLADEPTS